jgi:hypothetical protein
LGNHFHLVSETPRGNLIAGMKWLLGTYTQRFNRRHRLSGHLFQGRYKAQVIDAETPGYLRAACDYVHLNPARAGLVGRAEALENWRWSSYPQYLRRPQLRSEWLRTDRLLGEHGIGCDNIRGRRELAARMKAQRRTGDDLATLGRVRHLWMKLKAEHLPGPIFDGGARQAEVDRSKAGYEEDVAKYRQSVLRAFGEAEAYAKSTHTSLSGDGSRAHP